MTNALKSTKINEKSFGKWTNDSAEGQSGERVFSCFLICWKLGHGKHLVSLPFATLEKLD